MKLGVAIAIVIATLSVSGAASQQCESCIDSTRDPEASGTAVVLACTRLIQLSSIFSEDYQTLRRIAYVETTDGTSEFTNGGIWGVQEDIFNSTKTADSSILVGINTVFDVDWNTVQWEDLTIPLYSAIAARIYLQQRQNSGSDLSNITTQATVWSMDYNPGSNVTRYFSAVANVASDNIEVTQLQFGESFSKILTPFESIYLNISVEEDLLIQLDLIVNSGQAALYVSNLVIPSEAVHCGTIETNTSGQIHINTSEMSSYGSNQLLLITIMAMEEVTTLTFQSTQLHLKGLVNIDSESNEFIIGMFSNHPEAGSLPITLLITTTGNESVNFTVESIDGIFYEGIVNPMEGIRVSISDSFVVSNVTEIDKGIAIKADDEKQISVSVSSHYTYSSDSYLALPLIEYINIDEYTYYAVTPDTNITGLMNRVLLVGGYDNTTVTVIPTKDVDVSTVINEDGFLLADQSYTFSINRLETILLESIFPLTGTKVVTSKPITFLSGHQCAVVPESGGSCDFAIEQFPPTINWGKTFIFPLLSTRTGGSYFTLVAAEENTVANLWCYSNSTQNTLTDFIEIGTSGDYINLFISPDDVSCSVVSNGSIIITLIATTEDSDESSGDPLMIMVPPIEQYSGDISFVTPSDEFDVTFINLVSTSILISVNDEPIVDKWTSINSTDEVMLGFGLQFEIIDDVNFLSTDDDVLFGGMLYGFNFSVGYGHVIGMRLMLTEGDYGPLQVTSLEDYEITVGYDIQLMCTVTGAPTYAIRWLRGEEIISPSCKYSIASNDTSMSVLTIHDVNFNDDGEYECIAHSYYTESVSTQTQLIVTGSIQADLQPPGVNIIQYGDSITLSCAVNSDYNLSSLEYGWVFNYQTIKTFTNPDDLILTINYTDTSSIEQGGLYYCFATFDEDNITAISKTIFVGFSPLITEAPESILTTSNETVEFNCTATGHPTPVIEWYRLSVETNVSTLKDLSEFSIELPSSAFIETTITNTTETSILIIDLVDYDDFGYYVCVSALPSDSFIYARDCCNSDSEDGSAETTETHYDISNISTLSVSPEGSIEIDPSNIDASFGDNVTFLCSSLGGPYNQYQWTHLETDNIVSNEPELTVSSVSFNDGGNYQCEVSNMAGNEIAVSSLNTPANIVRGPEDQTVNIGGDVTFSCEFKSLLAINVVWLLNNTTLSPNSDLTITTAQNTSTLFLNDVSESDAGTYTCQVDNGVSEPVSESGQLIVGILNVALLPSGISILEFGESLQLSCIKNSNIDLNAVYYTWKFNNEVINHTNSSLTINYYSPDSIEQGGVYQCCVQSLDMILTGTSPKVLIAFGPLITEEPGPVLAMYNDSVELICTATGHPTPVIEWYRLSVETNVSNSIELPSSAFIEKTITNTTETSILIIDPVDYDDFGYYVCIASLSSDTFVYARDCCDSDSESGSGESIETVYAISNISRLSVSPSGSISINPLEIVTSFGDTISFNCSALGGPDNQYIWTHLTTVVGNDPQLTLSSVTFDDDGVYQCEVFNAAGNDIATSVLNVTLVSIAIINGPRNQTVESGDNINITCEYFSPLPLNVTWYFNGELLLLVRPLIVIDTTANISTLRLNDVDESDAGIYTCKIDNGVEEPLQANGTLIVGVLNILTPSGISTVHFGESLQLSCIINSTIDLDAVYYTWTFNNDVINHTSSSLTITYFSPDSVEQGGVYQCYTHALGMLLSGTSRQILIAFAPLITEDPVSVLAIYNDTVEFNCTAIGHPTPVIEWYRLSVNNNITTLEDVNKYSIELPLFSMEETITDTTIKSSTLIIDPVEYNDFGYYICVAKLSSDAFVYVSDCCNSESGSSSGEVVELYYSISNISTLSVSPEGSVMIDPRVIDASFGDNVTFICSSLGGPYNQYQWTYLETDNIVSNEPELTISSVLFNNGGNYQCEVSNAAGNDLTTSTVNVGPQIIEFPMDATVFAGDQIELNCTATGFPTPSIIWKHNGVIVNISDNLTLVKEVSVGTFGSTLRIESSSFRDAGAYVCTAVSELEAYVPVTTPPVTVTVVVPPVLLEGLENVTENVTESVEFLCSVIAIPEPTVTWYHIRESRQELINTGRINITQSTYNSGVGFEVTSMLAITSLLLEDAGVYECEAKEDIFNFTIRSLGVLTIQAPPFVQSISPQTISESITRPIILEFNISGDVPPVSLDNIRWTFNDIELMEDIGGRITYSENRRSLTINNLNLSDEGVYTLTATNPAGSSSASIFLDVQVPPLVIEGPMNKIVLEGQNITFSCIAEAEPTHVIEWLFDGRILFNNSKYTLTGMDTTFSMLEVQNVDINDAGNYTCVATNIHGMANTTALLEVQVPPTLRTNLESTNVTAGDTIIFNCTATGFPLPTIEWFKNDVKISPNDSLVLVPFGVLIITNSFSYSLPTIVSQLTIQEIDIFDMAMYYCQASNELAESFVIQSEIIQIQVQSPPDLLNSFNETTYNESNTLMLSCEFSGFPQPFIQWFYSASLSSELLQLMNGNRTRITDYNPTGSGFGSGNDLLEPIQPDEESEFPTITSYLVIVDLIHEDEGYYMCKGINNVANLIGATDSNEAFITVQRAPVVTSNLTSELIGLLNESVTLQFSIMDDSPLVLVESIRWTFNDVELVEDIGGRITFSENRLSLTITNLNLSDEGVYTLTATNLAGSSSASIFLNIQVSPIVIEEPADNKAIEGESVTFRCSIQSEPAHMSNWSFNGEVLVNDSKYTIEDSSEKLIIKSVNLTDAGEYTCTAENIHGTVSTSGMLFVQVPLVIINHPESSITRIAGEDAIFNCSSSGYPLPNISWLYNSNELTSTHTIVETVDNSTMPPIVNSQLTVKFVNLTDVGEYQCRAVNYLVRFLNDSSNSSILSLEYPANVSITPEVLVRSFNEEGTFTCSGFGIPVPTLTWSTDSGDLSDTNIFEITTGTASSSSGYTVAISNLTLLDTSSSIEGTYTCIGKNGITNFIGAVCEVNGSFFIEASPWLMAPQNETGLLGEQITLTFVVVHAAPLVVPEDIIWRFTPISGGDTRDLETAMDDRLVFSQNRRSLTIMNLTFDDDGEYIFQASNRIGNDSTTMRLIVYDPPNLISGFSDMTKNASDSLQLSCSFTGTPTPTIVWNRYISSGTETLEHDNDKFLIQEDVSLDKRTSTSALTVNDLIKDDEGMYECLGINQVDNLIGAVDSSQALITIQVPATIYPSGQRDTLIGVKDYEITISFVIEDAFPEVQSENIDWYFLSDATNIQTPIRSTIDNRYTFDEDRVSLTIADLDLIDRGRYIITATNEAGVRSSSIYLDIHVQPELLNYNGRITVINGTGGMVTFNCTADGIPRPGIFWRRDGILLLNNSRTTITYTKDPDSDRVIRVNDIDEIQQASSKLIITNLVESDSGLYTCRADNSAGEAAILRVPENLTVADFIPPDPFCTTNPNVCGSNGECTDTSTGGFICVCTTDEFAGRLCNDRVMVLIAPTLENVKASIGSMPEIIELFPPNFVSGELLISLSLTCTSSGNPQPTTTWTKISNENSVVGFGDTLLFPQLNLTERGFYQCTARNGEGSVSSEIIHVNISGVIQYKMELDLGDKPATSDTELNNLVRNISSAISGGQLIGTDGQFYSMERVDTSTSLDSTTVVVTILSNQGGNDTVQQLLMAEVASVLQQEFPTVTITDRTLDRFDGCSTTETLVPSYQSRNKSLEITIIWPETNLGAIALVECPCGDLNLNSTVLIATRECIGDYETGAQWSPPNVSPCNFTDITRTVCGLLQNTSQQRVEELRDITAEAENFEVAEVTVSVAVLVTATEDISGNVTLTENYLDVVDNILQVDERTLQESQETGNTSAILLESIESVTQMLPIPENMTVVVIAQDEFAVAVQEVPDDFSGQSISIDVGVFGNQSIDSDSLNFDNTDTMRRPTAEIELPDTLFQSIPALPDSNISQNTTSPRRLAFQVYITDSLFLRRDTADLEVGSVIVGATVAGVDRIDGIDPPVVFQFLSNPTVNGTDPRCVSWDPELDDGFGDWSSEGCVVGDYNETDGTVTCNCNHLTSFSMLLDVSPEIQSSPGPARAVDTALSAVTYIGCIISILCLLLTIASYVSNKKLRGSEHGQLLINLCISLIGLYTFFIVAIHGTSIPALCAVVAAILQYFFLTTFMLMAAEAINLYMKLVVVLGANIPHFILKVTIVCWVVPIFIVVFCFAPDYENYTSSHFCRAFGVPFYLGMLVPFIIIYMFNWVMFVVIFVSLLYKSLNSKVKDMKDQEKKSKWKQQFLVAITLSILFGLGWGIGLPATQQLQRTIAIRDTFAALFVCLTTFQGLFIFIMHCLRSPEIRKEWRRWFQITTGKDISELSTSATSRQKKHKVPIGSDATKSTSLNPGRAYNFGRKKDLDNSSTSVAGDEFSFTSDVGGNVYSTLQRNVGESGLLDNATTLQRFGHGETPMLPFIEEEEGLETQQNTIVYENDFSLSSSEDNYNATTFRLPDGVQSDYDALDFEGLDAKSIGALSTVSDGKKCTIFQNPIELIELGLENPFDSQSMNSQATTDSTLETDMSNVFINPLALSDDNKQENN